MNDNSKFNRLMMGIMLPKITLKNNNKNNNHEKIKDNNILNICLIRNKTKKQKYK